MRRLGDVAELISGQHVNAEHVNSAGIGNPYLTGPSDFDAGKPRATKWTKHGKAFCEPGDILITVKGSGCGTMAIADRRYVISRQLMAIRPLNIHVGFLWATLSREIARLNAMSSGTIPGLTRDQILKIPIPHFSHKVQRWIGDLDNLLTRLQQCLRSLIAAKREFQRGLMQELLTGRRRFPEFEGRPVEKCPFGSIVELRNEHYFPDKSNPRRCIELEHIESGTGRITGETLTTSENSVKFAFSAGDVLFGRLRPYLKKYAFPSFSGVCSTEIWVLRPRSADLLPEFLFLLVQGEEVQRAANVTSGSKMPRASWAVVAQALVPMPTIEEQRKICDIIASLDRELAALTELATHYQAQRRGLMQKLLTGELTVPVSSEPEPVHA